MSEKMIPLKLADLSVAACEAEIQKLRDENARLKTELDGYSNVVSTAHADLASENDRLKAEVERLNELAQDPYRLSKGWRPIETCPVNTKVLMFTPLGLLCRPDVFITDLLQDCHDLKIYGGVTHWMPLPKPPAAKEGKPSV